MNIYLVPKGKDREFFNYVPYIDYAGISRLM
jgi:hypothetical protein